MRRNTTMRPIIIGLLLFTAFILGCEGCTKDDEDNTTGAHVKLDIGYRASLPADMGALWAHENGAFKQFGVETKTRGYGPPHVLLQALRAGNVDLVTVMPLEPVLEDIRTGKANYYIFVLQCFSPTAEFDAIVTKRPETGETKWQSLADQALGVIPAKQNTLIGQAIVKDVGVDMTVRPYNPQNALLGLKGGDFGAVHVLGADVARAKAAEDKFAVLENCPASRRVFNGKRAPAGAGLISKRWVEQNPGQAKKVVETILRYSNKALANPRDPQLVAMLEMPAYGGFSQDVSKHLAFTPLIPYTEATQQHFEPLMSFLRDNNVDVPATSDILNHLYPNE